jgi:hypothetical protein
VKPAAAAQDDVGGAAAAGGGRDEGLDGAGGVDGDAVAAELVLERGGHLGVEGRHDLREGLHEVHIEAAVAELLRHLDADEARAADDGALCGGGGDPGVDAVHVLEVAQGEQAGAVDAWGGSVGEGACASSTWHDILLPGIGGLKGIAPSDKTRES